MHTYQLIIVCLVFSIFTVNTKASSWKKEMKNQIVDETLSLNDKVYILSHQKKRLNSINPNNPLLGFNSLQTKYYITEFNKEGDIEKAISFQSTLAIKQAVISPSGDLFVLMQGITTGSRVKKVSLKHFNSNFDLVQQSDFVLEETVDFNKMIYDDNFLYLMGIENNTQLVRLVKLTNSLTVEWMEELNGYPADVEFLNEAVYDLKVHQQNIYITFNSSKTIQVIGAPPVNANFAGVVAKLNSEGDLQWAKKIQYTNTNYLGSQVLNIVQVNQNGLWLTGNASPLCFEGCPKSVVYKMDLLGNMVSIRSLSPGFYNYINEGTALANGNLIFYGFSNDDVFAPPPSYSRSHLFVLDENLNELNHFISSQNQINTAQLWQGETVFESLLDFENNSIVYNTDNFLLRTNLNDMGCSELEPNSTSTGSVAFPTTSNIYINPVRLESINNVFSFAFSSTTNQFTISNICYDAGNTRLNKSDILTDWSISPNPSTDYIIVNNINTPDLITQATYSIYNTAGKQVLDGILTNKNISVKNLPKGIYYANIKLANTRYSTIKFVKQ